MTRCVAAARPELFPVVVSPLCPRTGELLGSMVVSLGWLGSLLEHHLCVVFVLLWFLFVSVACVICVFVLFLCILSVCCLEVSSLLVGSLTSEFLWIFLLL